jgi:hypothetical protein
VLHALQQLRSVIDDRLRRELGRPYEHHRAQSVGDDKLTVIFILRAGTPADAVRTAGLAAANLIELLTDTRSGPRPRRHRSVVRAE